MDGQPRCVAPPPSEDLIERSPAIGTGAPWRERMVIAGLRPSEDGMHRLYPGDTVHLTVFNDPNLSGDFSIDARGFVRLPLVGQVAAAGLTTSRLESRIADAFINGGFLSDPRIVVDVVNDRPLYIVGEIAEPGDTGTRVILTSP